MGIKSLNDFLKKKAPDAIITFPIEYLAGKRIAIDGNWWMYNSMAGSQKSVINRTDFSIGRLDPADIRREWIMKTMKFIFNWMKNGVTPVFVFDGSHQRSKEETRKKRREERKKRKDKIEELYRLIAEDELNSNLINDLRKELYNHTDISPEDCDIYKNILTGIGIPCLQADGDGEQLCCSLCIEGKVAAVFTEDTDSYTYGCPLTINYRIPAPHGHIGGVRLDRILENLKITHDLFVDFCIMCGCDFNTNIKRVGPVGSLKLLLEFGSIDDLPKHLDKSCLNHEDCRDIFKFTPSKSEFLDFNREAIFEARDFLNLVKLDGFVEQLSVYYKNLAPGKDGYPEELKLTPPPKYIPVIFLEL